MHLNSRKSGQGPPGTSRQDVREGCAPCSRWGFALCGKEMGLCHNTNEVAPSKQKTPPAAMAHSFPSQELHEARLGTSAEKETEGKGGAQQKMEKIRTLEQPETVLLSFQHQQRGWPLSAGLCPHSLIRSLGLFLSLRPSPFSVPAGGLAGLMFSAIT